MQISSNNNGKIKVEEDESTFSILSGGVKYQIDKSTGSINLYDKNKLLISSMNSNVWRAPISNERSEWGKAEADDWYRMGMEDLTNKIDSFEVNVPKDSLSAVIKVKSFTRFSRSYDLVINKFQYEFTNNGTVNINHEMTPLGYYDVSWLPCIGLALKMPNYYQNISWYGRGPYENYIDRNTGSKIGLHSASINSVQNPYIQPQEYGNYSQVRWFEIKNKSGGGIKVTADMPINFSAVPYYNLDRATYTYQLLKDDFSRVQINYGINGVGDTPNPTMPQYRLYPAVYSNSISITPL